MTMNDNESNSIAMNYIDHIISDVQASSWIRNELVFVYIHLHSGIVNTLFSRITMYDTKNKIIMHYSSPTMQFLNSWQKGQEAWADEPRYLLKWSRTYGGVQKNKENVQVQNVVCTVGTQHIPIHLLLQPSDVKQQHRPESNFDSDIGLMPVSTKPMLNPMLINHQCRSAPI